LVVRALLVVASVIGIGMTIDLTVLAPGTITTPLVAAVALLTLTVVDAPLEAVDRLRALIGTAVLFSLTFSALLANVSDTWPSTVTCWPQLFASNAT